MIELKYDWYETEADVIINVKLPVGITAKTVDYTVGSELINIVCPGNYLLRLYLKFQIDESTSRVIHKSTHIEFNLTKVEPKVWTDLLHQDGKNKKILTEKYAELLEKRRLEMVAAAKLKREKARENKDSSVNSQITREQNKRQNREDFKEKEKRKLEKSLEEKKENATNKVETGKKEAKQIEFGDCIPEYKKSPFQTEVIRKSKMAPPRTRGKIQIKFSERSFPTPVRESRKPEEDEWLQKQAQARKAAVDFENDLEPHEKEIGYLEEKGIKLLKNGDVEGSINAFNVAVKLFPQNPSLYMHRAAANLKFGNAIRGAQDAARALEMFIPPVPQNEPQRLQCHLLRGRSLRKLEMMTEALMDFTEAEKMDPKNVKITEEADRIRQHIQNNGDGWKDEWETDLLEEKQIS